jgi:hypothetical protein
VAAAQTQGGVRLIVDRERVTMLAYPGRVFMHEGRRYVVRDWTAADLERNRWLPCQLEDRNAQTLRWRRSGVTSLRLRPGKAPVVVRRSGSMTLSRASVTLDYRETVFGVVRTVVDRASGGATVERPGIDPKQSSPFSTSALVLAIDPRPELAVLAGLGLALGYVLPVHLGVEPDAIEIVPLENRDVVQQRSASGGLAATPIVLSGLALVDLYPNGIGLVETIDDDPSLLERVLLLTRDWLTQNGQEARSAIADSPLKSALDITPNLAGASDLLATLFAGRTAGLASRR